MTIGTLANNEIEAYKRGIIQLTEGDSFSQYENIRRINLYVRGKFYECSDNTAIFWQLSTPRTTLYAKSIGMDTKNFSMVGIGKFNWFKNFIANARFRQWAIDERLAITLDDTSSGVSTYGSMVWKKSFNKKGKVKLEDVNLSNLSFDQTVKDIIDSPVVEAHYMTESKIRNLYPDQAEDLMKAAKKGRDDEDNQAESEDDVYQILERWGEFKKEEDKDAKYYHWIGAGQGEGEVSVVNDEIKLNSDGDPKDFPYYDFHGERVPGRWQARGVVERLFELQEQANTLVNQNNEANQIASLLLFRTADPDTVGNILDAATSGQIINSQDMQQMGVDNRYIQTFLNQLQLIENKADSLCFITESISGDTPPSGVPFRSVAVATKAAKSTFTYIKTRIGEKMGWIIENDIMPDLVGEFNKEDLFEITEDNADVRLYDEVKIEDGLREYMKKRTKEGVQILFEEDLAVEKARIAKELERGGRKEGVKIDFKYGIRMNPTGESVDKVAMNAAIDGALEMMSANPAIANTPLFKQKLENNGIPPFRLTVEEQAELQQNATKLPEQQGPDKLSQLAEE